MSKKFKIGIAGTHSTGKSTLVKYLMDLFLSKNLTVGMVSELAPIARNLGFPILKEHTFESTLWIMSRGISLELEKSLFSDIVIVDRPVVDALAYLNAALKIRNEYISSNNLIYLSDITKNHHLYYDCLIKTKIIPDIPIDTNKERDHDPVFREMVDFELSSLIDKFKLQFVEYQNNIEETAENVMRIWDGHNKN